MDRDQIEQLNKIRESASRERDKLDKLIFVIIAGTLSLSITFIAQSERVFSGLKYLHASWTVLIAGLVVILAGYTFAILHFRRFEKGVSKNRFNSFQEAQENCWFYLTEICNWLSLFAAVVGIGLFAYFGYLNSL